jgi:hypothetical protein
MERLRTVAAFSCYRILFYTVPIFILTITLSCSRKTLGPYAGNNSSSAARRLAADTPHGVT